jgi:drug efflux transport system ATP-binding protein
MENEPAIIANKLSKKFGDFIAVDSISFEIYPGEIFGFLGANGAGKTTAIKMLCGLHRPSSGEAKIAGFDIYKNPEGIKRNIGYMSQHFSLYEDLTIRENIRFYAGIYGIPLKTIREKSDEMIEKLELDQYANRLVSALPLGWKQKLAFSIAVLHDPGIVFLDEPTSGVDPITRRQFWNLIYETADRGITVFVTTHYLDEAEYCNRVSIMVDGKMKEIGTPQELILKYHKRNMNEVFLKMAERKTKGELV